VASYRIMKTCSTNCFLSLRRTTAELVRTKNVKMFRHDPHFALNLLRQ